MKWIFITVMVLIGLLDYALFVACSQMESREQYMRRERDMFRAKGGADDEID